MPPDRKRVCGIWATRRAFVAVILEPDGRERRPISAPSGDDGRWGLLEYLAEQPTAVVLSEAFCRKDLLGNLVLRGGLDLYLAPTRLVELLQSVSGLRNKQKPKVCAAMLARLAANPTSRAYLRRLLFEHDPRQMKLI